VVEAHLELWAWIHTALTILVLAATTAVVFLRSQHLPTQPTPLARPSRQDAGITPSSASITYIAAQ
jgi:hypothetical protein